MNPVIATAVKGEMLFRQHTNTYNKLLALYHAGKISLDRVSATLSVHLDQSRTLRGLAEMQYPGRIR
jgi:hypothetical protein